VFVLQAFDHRIAHPEFKKGGNRMMQLSRPNPPGAIG
jgi:hypothetical protein